MSFEKFFLHLYLHYVFTLVPLGDEEQLGQTLRVMVADLCAKLPQELLLVLEELCVVFVVHDFLQLHVLRESDNNMKNKQEAASATCENCKM